ncbi:MAG: nucleotidyltransferase domain-containing protein [Candidatus Peribacteraceae bacterium]|nr:nucleotidyltransferase domain-containing protein [Candidatus Peribacteraceae bacterium]
MQKARTLKMLLERHGFPVTQVLLFGSVAKGASHPRSDIDIAVIHLPFGNSRMEELHFLCRVEQEEDLRNIEVVYFHPEDLEDKYSTLVREVKKYGLPV